MVLRQGQGPRTELGGQGWNALGLKNRSFRPGQAHTPGSPAAAAAKSLQSCPTLCDPIDGRPPGSRVPGILQARILEWVAISSRGSSRLRDRTGISHVSCIGRRILRLLATPWSAAYQAPPSMGFARQEYWSGVPLPSPRESHYSPAKSSLTQTPVHRLSI